MRRRRSPPEVAGAFERCLGVGSLRRVLPGGGAGVLHSCSVGGGTPTRRVPHFSLARRVDAARPERSQSPARVMLAVSSSALRCPASVPSRKQRIVRCVAPALTPKRLGSKSAAAFGGESHAALEARCAHRPALIIPCNKKPRLPRAMCGRARDRPITPDAGIRRARPSSTRPACRSFDSKVRLRGYLSPPRSLSAALPINSPAPESRR